jgi:hypothetical protein
MNTSALGRKHDENCSLVVDPGDAAQRCTCLDNLYRAWQDFERQVDRDMDNGGTARESRTDAAIAKEAYLRACEAAGVAS